MTAAAAKTEIPGHELLEGYDKPSVILFHASWCSPCKEAVPEVEKAVAAQTDKAGRAKFRLVKIDIDKYTELSSAFGINSIPAMVGFHGDKASFGVTGRLPEKMLMEFLSRVEQFHKDSPPPAWRVPEPEPAPEVNVQTGGSINIMKPIRLGQKKTGWKWLR
ncbi:MAG: thioredoxin family protein [Alphaproteobacteria bacterium]